MLFLRMLSGFLTTTETPPTGHIARDTGVPDDLALYPDAPRLETIPTEPRFRAEGGSNLRMLRAVENELLTSYGWIDREAGIARIPIERAMEIVAANGLPNEPQGEEGN
jgi:hypothetical protein